MSKLSYYKPIHAVQFGVRVVQFMHLFYILIYKCVRRWILWLCCYAYLVVTYFKVVNITVTFIVMHVFFNVFFNLTLWEAAVSRALFKVTVEDDEGIMKSDTLFQVGYHFNCHTVEARSCQKQMRCQIC